MIYSIIVGAFTGWIASLIMKADGAMGAIKNILAGIIGGTVGGWILGLVGLQSKGGFVGNLIVGIFGACVVIAIYRLIFGRK